MNEHEQRIRLKCRHENEIHSVVITPQSSISDVKKRLASGFGFEVSLKYEDREGDFISLSSQSDLTDLFFLEGNTVNVVVIEALPQLTKQKSSSSNASQPLLAPISREWSRNNPSSVSGPSSMNNFRLPNPSTSTNMLRAPDRFPSISDNSSTRVPDNSIRWKRGEILGQGAFGVVFLGLNIDTGELMAVKQISTEEVSKKEMSSLENEINLLRNLRHPNIVRYIGTELTPTALSIFLEYVPGGSLKALIDKFGQLEESVARSYTRQLLLGLEYLHRNGIAHRDIKGANCLVGNDGVIKLADFGSSKHWRPSPVGTPSETSATDHTSGDIKGTPSWMAPEVVRGMGEVNWKKADIWSLACTTLEMTTGKPPWAQFNNSVTILYHLACQDTSPEYPSVASPELLTFLNVCFQRDPALRPDVTSLLLHPFVAVMSWQQVTRPTTMSSLMVGGQSSFSTVPSNKRSNGGARVPSLAVTPLLPVVAPLSARSTSIDAHDMRPSSLSARMPSSRAMSLPTPTSLTTTATPGSELGDMVTPRLGVLNTSPLVGLESGAIPIPLGYSENPEITHEVDGPSRVAFGLSYPASPDYLSDFTVVDTDSIPPGVGLRDDQVGLEPTDPPLAMVPHRLSMSPSSIQGLTFQAQSLSLAGSTSPKGRAGGGFGIGGSGSKAKARKAQQAANAGKRRGGRGGRGTTNKKALPAVSATGNIRGGPPTALSIGKGLVYDSDDQSASYYPAGDDWDGSSLQSGGHGDAGSMDEDDGSLVITSIAPTTAQSDSIVRDWSSPHVGLSQISGGSVLPGGFDYSDTSLRSLADPTSAVQVPSTGATTAPVDGIVGLKHPFSTRDINSAATPSMGTLTRIPSHLPPPISTPNGPAAPSGALSIQSSKKSFRPRRTSGREQLTSAAPPPQDLLEISCDSLDPSILSGPLTASSTVAVSRASKAVTGTSQINAPPSMQPNPPTSSGVRQSSAHRVGSSAQQSQEWSGGPGIIFDPSEVALIESPPDDVAEVPLHELSVCMYEEHTSAVTRLRAPARAPHLLLSASTDGTVRIYDVLDGMSVARAVLDNAEFAKDGVGSERRVSLGMGGDESNSAVAMKVCKVTDMWAEEGVDSVWTGCVDHTVRVWSGVECKPIRVLKGHEEGITCLEGLDSSSVTSAGALVASGSSDHTVRIWDARSRKAQVFLFRGHGDSVGSVRWLEAGRALASSGKDKTVRIWDTRAGRLRCCVEKHFGTPQGLRVLPDQHSAAPTSSLTSSPAQSAHASAPPSFVSFARDSMLCFYSASGDVVACHTAAHRGHLSALSESSVTSYGHPNSYLLSAGVENTIKVWDTKRMKCVADVPHFASSGLGSQGGSITRLAWCRGGFLAGTSTGQLRFFHQAAGTHEDTPHAMRDYTMVELPSFTPTNANATSAATAQASHAPVSTATNSSSSSAAGCSDLVATPSMLAVSSRNGKILRWAFPQ